MATNQRFTEKAQEAILQAQRQTDQLRLSQFEPEVILQALLNQTDGIAPQVVLKAGVDLQQAIRAVTAEVERLPKLQYSAEASVSNATRKLLENAENEARQFGDEYLSTEHLLLGALSLQGSAGVTALNRLGLTI